MRVSRKPENKFQTLLEKTGAGDPITAVRICAKNLIIEFRQHFDNPMPPFDMEALASYRGITIIAEPPRHSWDAELQSTPEALLMRINRDRPKTRQRFSIAHEIGHTFLPDYEKRIQCRSALESNDDKEIEKLCDIAAAELILPLPWFQEDANSLAVSAKGIDNLARTYIASTDATVRRYIDVTHDCCAAIFLSWKLKPTELRDIKNPDQEWMFGMSEQEQLNNRRKLRIDYACVSRSFQEQKHVHFPKDLSLSECDIVDKCTTTGQYCDGEASLDFGSFRDLFKIWSLPIYTPKDKLGPKGERAVVLIIHPL